MVYRNLAAFALLLFLDAVVYGFGSSARALRRDEGPESDASEPESESGTAPQQQHHDSQALLRKILRDQSDYVDTVQTVTAMINAVYGAVFGLALGQWLSRWWIMIAAPEPWKTIGRGVSFIIAWLILFFCVGVFGVQIPKRMAAANPEKWNARCGRVFYLLLLISLPFIRLVSLCAKGILLLLGIRSENTGGDVTEEEIRSIVHEGREQGVLDPSETEMITNIFEFNDKEAEEIMTQRGDIVAVDAKTTLQDTVTYMLGLHFSRIPVYVDNIDNIKGIVHLRDVVEYREVHPDEKTRHLGDLKDVLRDPVFVPETKNIDDLFRDMQRDKTQLVIVIDEYGQTAGLIAMEDILEEIVGNIMDEYDIDENHITPAGGKNEYLVDGRTPLEDLEDRFHIHFDDDRVETLNGFLMSRMDRVPLPNDHYTCEYKGWRFRVLTVSDHQIQRVLMTKLDGPAKIAAAVQQESK